MIDNNIFISILIIVLAYSVDLVFFRNKYIATVTKRYLHWGFYEGDKRFVIKHIFLSYATGILPMPILIILGFYQVSLFVVIPLAFIIASASTMFDESIERKRLSDVFFQFLGAMFHYGISYVLYLITNSSNMVIPLLLILIIEIWHRSTSKQSFYK